MPLFAALALCLYAGAATSSNGYFLNGWGMESRSMAGAGVAMAEGAMVIATNPGGLALVRDDQFQVGTTFLHASPAYGASDFPGGTPSDDATFPINPGTRKGDPDVPLQVGGIFAIPHGAVTHRLDERSLVGLGCADGNQPVPNDQLLFNLLAGSVIEKHYSAGFTYRFSPRNAVDIGVLYSPKNEIHGRNPGASEQTLRTSLSAASLDLSWQHRF